MISDNDRREVTRRLRDWTWKSAPSECLLNQLVFGDDCPGMNDNPDTISCHECEFMAAQRLADLIEPDEPPYNLYTLYEAVFRRSPRCWECIEDDEVEELVDALLDFCNAPGHEHIQRSETSEPKVRCVAEVKVDGERLEKLVHDAAVELTGIDRDALLALADEMEAWALTCDHYDRSVAPIEVWRYARRIREACGEVKS